MSSNINKLSIVLPTYNEAENILELIKKIEKILKNKDYEIIVVDDDSKDNTGRIVQKYFKNNNKVKTLIRNKRGLATAILTGCKYARGGKILVMDTDFNHDPKMIPKMLNALTINDMVVGSRYAKDGGMENKFRNILSRYYNLVIRHLLKLPVHDALSGFFMFKKEKLYLLLDSKIFQGYGEYFIRLLFRANALGLQITEIPVFYKNRTAGISKSKFINMFWDYTKVIFELYRE